MKASRTLAVSAMLTATVVFPACIGRKPALTVEVPVSQTPRDEALSRSVQARLAADKKADLNSVTVVSNGGTVFLTGTVKSLDARQQAVKLAWEVRGVQNVVNALEVDKLPP